MMQATNRQINLLLTSDIIHHTIDLPSFFTDAIFDESCNRTPYGSNWVILMDISFIQHYKS
jgi:hypothetical protein